MNTKGIAGKLGRVSVAGVVVAVGAALGSLFSTGSASAMDSEESQVLALINEYRAANGLGALAASGTLTSVAQWKGQDMANNNYFSHTDSQGRDPFAMMNDFGYTYNTWKGENLAAGVSGAQAAFDLWKGSPGHNANMLNPNYTVIGISRAFNESSVFGWYWSTEFGGQADIAPAPEPVSEPQPVEPTLEVQPAPATPVQVSSPAPEASPAAPAPATESAPAPVIERETETGTPHFWQISDLAGTFVQAMAAH